VSSWLARQALKEHVVAGPLQAFVISEASTTVDIPPMPNGYDKNDESLILYLKDDPVITNADAPSFSASELFDSHRSGFFGKFPYSHSNSITIRLSNSGQLFLGTPFNE
jgi:hypothetical protein